MSETAVALLRALENARTAQRAVESVSSSTFPDATIQDLARDLNWTSRKLMRVAALYGASSQAIQRVEAMNG